MTWMHGVEAQRAEVRELTDVSFPKLEARVATTISELRQEMRLGFTTLAGELRREMAELEARLERRIGDLIKWSFVFWVSAVGAIAALAGVLG